MARLREALKTDNVEEINSAAESLTMIWHEAAEKMYKSAGTGPGGPGPDGDASTPPKDKPVDADFEVVD